MKLLFVRIGIVISLTLSASLGYADIFSENINKPKDASLLRTVIENLFNNLESQQHKLSISSEMSDENVCQLIGELDSTLDSLKAALNKFRSSIVNRSLNSDTSDITANEAFYLYIKQQAQDVSSYLGYVKGSVNCAKSQNEPSALKVINF